MRRPCSGRPGPAVAVDSGGAVAAAHASGFRVARTRYRELLRPCNSACRRALAGIGDVGVENGRLVLLVRGDPGDGNSVVAKPAAAFGKQGRLAEPAGRLQHRQAAAGRHGPLHKPGAVEIAGHPVGHRDLLAQQPGKRPLVAGSPVRLPRGFPRVTAARARAGLAHRSYRAADFRPRRCRARIRVAATARSRRGCVPQIVGLLHMILQQAYRLRNGRAAQLMCSEPTLG